MDTPILKVLAGIVIALLIVLACGIALSLTSCESPKCKTTDISAMADVTEPLLIWPDAKELLSLYELEKNQMNGAAFRLLIINDVSQNRQLHLSLPAVESSLTMNRFERKEEIERFEKAFVDSIASLTKDTVVGRSNSSVYLPMVRELERLAQSSAERRVLIVYSDLMENTPSLTFYDKRTLALMRTDPDRLKTQLQAQSPLANLEGIEVHFIFQPKNALADETFRLVSGFYKSLLESKGAIVRTGANLTY